MMVFDSVLPTVSSSDNNSNVNDTMNNNEKKMKIRKPYTITKTRQNWSDVEHDKFLEALTLFDRDWKKIEAFVGSKTAIQIRSHAQKYFLKVQKSGTNEHVPPPRPKRKASHPYPHKAPQNDVQNVGVTPQPATDLIKHEDIVTGDSYLWPIAPTNMPIQDDVRLHNSCSSSIDSGPGIWPTGETNNYQVKQRMAGRVLPDFPTVYRFIGKVFDPNESNHLQNLKMMDPVDVETVVLLMKNLCANLKSPQFENYRRLFSSYDAGTGKVASNRSFHAPSRNAITTS